MKGIIALDIDGTITEDFHSTPSEVNAYLRSLAAEGWQLVFITGRTYSWAFRCLKDMRFPYYFAVQNGAIILEMPSKQIVNRKYLDKSIYVAMDEICAGEATDYVIYSGYENEDVCYYRPSHFSPKLLEYLKTRIDTLEETYQAVPSYTNLPITAFPSIKCFGLPEDADRIARKMESALGMHVTPVRDPFDENYRVAQATHPDATKGLALKEMAVLIGNSPLIISAGNDYNDMSMFAASDLKVVMGNAPADLFAIADIVAPSVSERGIIPGLKEAIKLVSQRLKS